MRAVSVSVLCKMRAVFLCLVKRWPRPQWRVFARKGSSIATGSEIGKPDPRIRQSGLRGEPELLDSLGPLPSAVAGLDRDWTAVFLTQPVILVILVDVLE